MVVNDSATTAVHDLFVALGARRADEPVVFETDDLPEARALVERLTITYAADPKIGPIARHATFVLSDQTGVKTQMCVLCKAKMHVVGIHSVDATWSDQQHELKVGHLCGCACQRRR